MVILSRGGYNPTRMASQEEPNHCVAGNEILTKHIAGWNHRFVVVSEGVEYVFLRPVEEGIRPAPFG
jgi:hypothetical protein